MSKLLRCNVCGCFVKAIEQTEEGETVWCSKCGEPGYKTGDDMTIEEQVARVICPHSRPAVIPDRGEYAESECAFCETHGGCPTAYEETASKVKAILSLPDIKRGLEQLESCRYEDGFEAAMSREDVMRGLELVELEKARKLVMLAEDQEPPSRPFADKVNDVGENPMPGYIARQCLSVETGMLEAGFKRVTQPIKEE